MFMLVLGVCFATNVSKDAFDWVRIWREGERRL